MASLYKIKDTWYISYYEKRGGKNCRIRKRVSPDKGTANRVREEILKYKDLASWGIKYQGADFESFIKRYLEYSKTNKSRDSFYIDRSTISSFTALYNVRNINEISPLDIESFKSKLISRALKPRSINRLLGCIKTMFNRAFEWGFVKHNPAINVKGVKVPDRGRIRFLTEPEINRLLSKCSGTFKPILRLFLMTGMRRSELVHLKWSDIDFGKRLINVFSRKTNQFRYVPMNGPVYELLKGLGKGNGNGNEEYIFKGKKGAYYPDSITTYFRILCRRLNIQDARIHDLRHTFASHLIQKGVNIAVISALLGHSNIKTTQIYSHLSGTELNKAVDKLAF